MKALRILLEFMAAGSLLWGRSTPAASYYIDYQGGSDANDGGSVGTAWKLHPYMAGFGGSYSHAAGDRFVFKGGVTWPRIAFQMRIAAGGSSDAARDYYGADPAWYAGDTWARPSFDFENTLIPGGWYWSAGIVVDNVSYITFDNLEMMRHQAPLNNPPNMGDWGACTLLFKGNVNFVTVQNCLIRDWAIPTPIVAPAQDGGGGGGIFKIESQGGEGLVVTRCVLHQSGSAVKSGAALHLGGEVSFCEIYETCNGLLGGGVIHDNHVYNIRGATDPTAHENAIYTFSPSKIYNNRVHNLDTDASAIYASPSFSGGKGYDVIYNNVVYAVGNQAPVQIDLEGAHPEQTGSRIYNNTLEHVNGYCVRVGIRGGAVLGLLDCRNNHFITSGAAIGYSNPQAGCAYVNSITLVANLVQTPQQASGSGFSATSQYLPKGAGVGTVKNGLDLSSIFTNDIRGMSRQAGAWDIGAYQFASNLPDAPASASPPARRAGPSRK